MAKEKIVKEEKIVEKVPELKPVVTNGDLVNLKDKNKKGFRGLRAGEVKA